MLRAQNGNFGDTEPVGNGLSEVRAFVGPGYRMHHPIRPESYLMLYGSNKTDQKRGIKRAKEI